MKIESPERRLDRFWGKVDRKHIELIGGWLRGPRVLDLGCGYGSFTEAVQRDLGFECVGVDAEEENLEIARRRFPTGEFIRADAEDLPLETGSFDSVVLKDTLHHLVEESDWERVSRELLRVSAPRARLIFFDPNVHALLRIARRGVRHEDAECTFEQATALMRELGYKQIHTSFHTLFSQPLSGGFVGPELVPNRPRVHGAILRTEEKLEQRLNRRGLGRGLAWRYLVVGERVTA
jgi:ubiquinone/menaquinone biosynthesis C-methylase UbiE